MNITNLQRDSIHTELLSANQKAWSAESLIAGDSFLMNSSGVVNQVTGQVQSSHNSKYTISADSIRGVGVFMQPPSKEDATPYRVIAQASSITSGLLFAIAVGFAPASITGSDDIIKEPSYFPFSGRFDGVIMVPKVPAGDTYIDRPIAIAVVAADGSAGPTQYIMAHLSAQNLAVAPPAFAQSTS